MHVTRCNLDQVLGALLWLFEADGLGLYGGASGELAFFLLKNGMACKLRDSNLKPIRFNAASRHIQDSSREKLNTCIHDGRFVGWLAGEAKTVTCSRHSRDLLDTKAEVLLDIKAEVVRQLVSYLVDRDHLKISGGGPPWNRYIDISGLETLEQLLLEFNLAKSA